MSYYYLGVDEAGYGPNLGPLVISASVWRVPNGCRPEELYQRLAGAVTAEVPRGDDARVPIADSKLLYKSKQGLAQLERSVQGLLSLLGERPESCEALWRQLAPEADSDRACLPWHADGDETLPLAADVESVQQAADVLRQGLERANVQLLAVRSVAVFPERFNQRVAAEGNKGAALSRLTIELVDRLLAGLDDAPVLAVCDKHGGRHFYGPLLQTQFADWLVEVRSEGAEESVYRWGPRQRRVEARFCCRAEQYLPVAVASMVSKYLREVAMRAFNRFWCGRLPELKPTAGYPGDSRRFKQAIADTQRLLGIDDRVLWRAR